MKKFGRPGRARYLSDFVNDAKTGAQRWKGVAREALKRLRVARGNVDHLEAERNVLAIELWGALRALQSIGAHFDAAGPAGRRCDDAAAQVRAAMQRADRVLVRCKKYGPSELELMDRAARAAAALIDEMVPHIPQDRQSEELVAVVEAIAALKSMRGGSL